MATDGNLLYDRWQQLAYQPVDSKYWRSSDGEEYKYTCDANYLVTNEKAGTKRIRTIWKFVQEIVVE